MSFVRSLQLRLVADTTNLAALRMVQGFDESLHQDTKTIVEACANPLAVAWSPDNKYVALGCYDCTVRIYCPETAGWQKPLFVFNSRMIPGAKNLRSPVTSLKFRPAAPGSNTTVLLVGCSDGGVSQWHIGSGRVTTSFHEQGNQVLSLDFKPNGGQFVTTGSDFSLRIYDDERVGGAGSGIGGTKDSSAKNGTEPSGVSPTLTLNEGEGIGLTAHTARVQTVKWVDENTILSGGWDGTIQVWDVRQPKPVRSMFGATIYCTDGLDVHPTNPSTIVTASGRDTEVARSGCALQVWDWAQGKRVCDVQWPELYQVRNKTAADLERLGLTLEEFNSKPKPIVSLMCCKFSSCGQYLAAGGETDFRVFDTKSLLASGSATSPIEIESPKVVGEWTPGKAIEHCVYCAAFSNGTSNPQLLVGAGSSHAFVMTMTK